MKDGIAADLTRLLRLQKEDTRLQEITARIAHFEAGPDVARARQALASLEERQQTVAGKLQDARLLASRREGEADQHHKERQRLEARLYGGEIVSTNEVEKMQNQIAHLQELAAAAEEEALLAMESMEELTADEADLAEKAAQAARELAAEEERQEQELAAARETAQAVQAQRDSAAAAIVDETLLRQYERMLGRSGTGGLAVAPVQRGACGGCDVSLSVGLLNRVKKMDALYNCEHCGRGLVYVG